MRTVAVGRVTVNDEEDFLFYLSDRIHIKHFHGLFPIVLIVVTIIEHAQRIDDDEALKNTRGRYEREMRRE